MLQETNIYNIREGFTFSSNLVSPSGEVLLKANTPITKDHVIDWILKGKHKVFTEGELIKGNADAKLIIELLEKEFLSQNIPSSLSSSESYIHSQKQLEISLILEQLIIKSNRVVQRFIHSKCTPEIFRKRIIWTSTKLIHLMETHHDILLKIISYTNMSHPEITHSFRVALIALYIGMQKNLDFPRLLTIAIASLLHDIGKHTYEYTNTHEQITIKKERLKLHISHPLYSYKLAKDTLNLKEEICQAILHHHERLDGKGFPFQRKDNDLFITDRILITANIFANLIENNNLQGLETPYRSMKELALEDPSACDPNIIKTLSSLEKLIDLTQKTQSPPKEQTNYDESPSNP